MKDTTLLLDNSKVGVIWTAEKAFRKRDARDSVVPDDDPRYCAVRIEVGDGALRFIENLRRAHASALVDLMVG